MKPVLKFNIRNQKISRVDNFLPVRYSKNYLYAEFDFKTEDWTLVAKTAIFTSQNYTIHVVLGATDTCLVPPEVLTDTWFTVSVFGGDLITVTTEKIKLYESGYRPDGVPEPTPDVYTQLLNMLSSKADGLSYSDNILSLLSGDKTIATVTITSASDEGDSTAREIELRSNGTYIQWKYTDETLWRDLVSLEEISGKDAYKYAQEAGYTKSEEQFVIDLAKEPGATEEQAKQIEQNKTDIENLQQDMGNKANSSQIPTKLSQLEEDTTHRVVTDEEKENWNNKSNFSGSYNDLTDQPTIPTMPTVPTKVSQLENDSNYQTDEQVQNKIDTALEGLELPSGGSEKEWTYIGKFTAEENINPMIITQKENGEEFGKYKELMVRMQIHVFQLSTNDTRNLMLNLYLDNDTNVELALQNLGTGIINVTKSDNVESVTPDFKKPTILNVKTINGYLIGDCANETTNNNENVLIGGSARNRGSYIGDYSIVGIQLKLGHLTNLIIKGSFLEVWGK